MLRFKRLVIISVLICLANARFFEKENPWISDEELESTTDVPYEPRYEANWDSLATRPLPEWYDKAKIGIMVHWGLFSVPSFKSEWFWGTWKGSKNNECEKFMKNNYPPGFTYQEFAPLFTAEFFDAKAWAELFARAGAKYVVLTSKHHDGYTLFPSKRSFSWNSVDVGPHRDLTGELSEAVKSENLKFGVSYSMYEWNNPMFIEDKQTGFKTQTFINTKVWPEIKQLVNDYKPSIIWSNGAFVAPDYYWRSTELISWLYNESPVKDEVVVSDKWGKNLSGKHGDFYTGDKYNPNKVQKKKWENIIKIDGKSWGYRRNMEINELMSFDEMLYQVVRTVSVGGNILINVGATKEGTIVPIFQERLLALGKWLSVNGEAIYGSVPWSAQRDSVNYNVWYTCTHDEPTDIVFGTKATTTIYAIFLDWPENNLLEVKDLKSYLPNDTTYTVEMLGKKGLYLTWNTTQEHINIQLPKRKTVISQYAWTLKFTLKPDFEGNYATESNDEDRGAFHPSNY